eukprot:UN23328
MALYGLRTVYEKLAVEADKHHAHADPASYTVMVSNVGAVASMDIFSVIGKADNLLSDAVSSNKDFGRNKLKEEEQNPEEKFIGTMKNIFGENLVSVRFCEDLSAVMPVYDEWQTAVTSVENVVENDKEKIGTNPCSVIGCCGFCFTTYEQAIETEGEKRKAFYETNVEELKNTQVAFVTFG